MISKRILTGFAKTSWVTHKHHLFNAHIPEKLFKAIRENATNDKKDESGQSMVFQRVSKIPISKALYGWEGWIL